MRGARISALLGPPVLLVSLLFVACPMGQQKSEAEIDSFQQLRRKMVRQQLAGRDIRDARVLRAMREVPRHLFVPPEVRALAYQDHPLPIGYEQTISQPYVVALMTQLARPSESDRALEVGTGSGYQAAVLSRLVKDVYTIEIIPELAAQAESVLESLHYDNVKVRAGDGYLGWPQAAPFDIILVTAAADRVPEPLKEQLAEGGRLIMPLGRAGGMQLLTLLVRRGDQFESRTVASVRFVPMTGKARQRKP